ncbi:SDR family oxidoreductase [Burkholderia diffusa]|uniref:SDR family oxidoreductase n=1 Tax=Burkholderia diffusa TaxID=488732 RepID=UPI002ABE7FE8|nr:SDR family oxidoreductase [Burkholderia diffusa]
MSKNILVLGAGGNVGRPLIDALLAKGESVKAASRSGGSVAGAEGVRFDYADPATYANAIDGIDRAYVMLPTGYVDSRGLLLPIIEALATRNIKVVFQSVLGVDADDSIPYRQVELALERSGTRYVILRPNWFADNFHTFWKTGIQHGVIAVPAGEGKSSFIDARDIAACAAAALTSDRFDGHAFDLTGPEALSYAQAAEIISDTIGMPVRYDAIDDPAFIDMLVGAGVPSDYAAFLASIFYPVREGWTAAVTDGVARLTGAQPRSLHIYAADHAAALKA